MYDEIITFETAKLAKEKGGELWDWNDRYYDPNDETHTLQRKWSTQSGCSTENRMNRLIKAPTQSFLQKWLREIHNIHINIWFMGDDVKDYKTLKWSFEIKTIAPDYKLIKNQTGYESFEKALEAGLQEGLKII